MRSFRLCHRFRAVRRQSLTPAARRMARTKLGVIDDGTSRIAPAPATSPPTKRMPRMFVPRAGSTQQQRETDDVQDGMIMAVRAERGWR